MTENSQVIKKCMYIDLSNIYGGIAEIFEAGIYIDFSTLMPLLDEKFGGIDQFKVYGAYMGYDKKPQTIRNKWLGHKMNFLTAPNSPVSISDLEKYQIMGKKKASTCN